MSDEIFFDGVRHISAGQAAQESGLTRDYIARLCKEGKLSGHRIGKNWYVDPRALQQFLVLKEHARAKRSEDLSQERIREYHGPNATAISTSDNRVPLYSPPRVFSAATAIPAAAQTVRKYDHPAGTTVSLPKTGSVGSGFERGNEIREKLAHALSASATQAKRLSDLPAGITHAALQGAHIPTYTLTPAMEFLHKVAALTLAVMLTFGTYAAVDPQYAHFAADSVSDSVASAIASTQHADQVASVAQTQFAAAAENPGGTLGSFFAFFPSAGEALAKAVNKNVNALVYSVAFPIDLVHSLGNVANVQRGEVAVQIEPYARALSHAALTQTNSTPVSAAPAPSHAVSSKNIPATVERIVETQRIVQAGGISEEELNLRLQQLDNKLSSQIASLAAANSTAIVGAYQAASYVAPSTSSSGSSFNGTTATLSVTGSATSTFAAGINISGGCFAVNGTCITGGGSGTPGGSDTQVQYNNNGAFAGSSGFTFSSSTKTLSITNASTTLLSVGNGSATTTIIGQATSTFGSGIQANAFNITGSATSTAANGFNLSAGCFAVNGTCISGGSSASSTLLVDHNTWSAIQLFNGGASSSQESVFTKFYAGGTATTTIDSAGNLAVGGTLTAYASSTIGAGGQTTGLTIFGGATTTGSLYVGGNTGLGIVPTASQRLLVSGQTYLTNLNNNELTFNSTGSNYVQFYDNGAGGSSGGLAIGGASSITGVPTTPTMFWNVNTNAVGVGTSSTSDTNGNTALKVQGANATDVLHLTNGTNQFGAFFTSIDPRAHIQFQTITNDNFGFATNNGNPQFVLNTNGGASFGTTFTLSTPPSQGVIIQGNVGIGTTSPWKTLSVAGDIIGTNITATGTLAAAGLASFTAGASSSQESVFTKFYAGGTATTTIDSAGNVAVAGTLNVTGKSTLGAASTTNFSNSGNSFFTGLTASSLLALDNTGKLIASTSIGTNLLTGTLATINGTAVSAGGSATITAASSTLLSNNNTFSGSNIFSSGLLVLASTTIGNGTQAGGLTINGGATTTGNAYFAGNVGINTTAPTHLFQVGTPNNSASSNDIATFASSNYGYLSLNGTNGSSNVGVGFNQGSSGGTVGNNFLALGIVGTQGDSTYGLDTTHSGKSNGDIVLQTYYSATFHPILTAPVGTNNAIFDGNVGIGTTTPWKRLSVAGDIIGTNITATGTLAVAGLASFTAGASTTNASNFGTAYFGGSATTTIDSAGNLAFGGNVSGAGLISCSGTFDKVTYNSTTKQFGCSADQTSGGGAGVWATTTNSLAIYPSNTSYVVLVGTNATTTTGNILEVAGNSLLRGNLNITGNASTTLFSNFGTAYFGGTATSSFNSAGQLSLAGITSSLLAANASGQVIASTSIGTNLLTGTLATINGTAVSAGGSATITAASSTLLINNNTFSGSNVFSSLLNLTGGASTTQLSVFAKAYFGGSATSSFDSAGILTLADQGTSSSTILTLGGRQLLNASSSASVANIFLGLDAGSKIVNGTLNTGFGYQALLNATTTSRNTAVGYQALKGDGTTFSGSSNTALGYIALQSNSSGSNNTAVGDSALFFNTTGSGNTAVGFNALNSTLSGSNNTALGYNTRANASLDASTTVVGAQAGKGAGAGSTISNSTFLGAAAGYSISSGNNNTLLGYGAGYSLTTGSSNIALGYNVDLPSNTGSQQVNIGNLIFGSGIYNGSTLSSAPVSGGAVGIGTSTPFAKFAIHANNGETFSKLFEIASSTSNATTSLFSISNTGAITQNGITNSLISADNTGKLIASTTIGTNLLSANTISGVALGGTLANHSHNATLSGTSYNGSAAISDWGLNLANANSWTGLQQFTNASTTLFSSFGPAYFGSTATSSFGTNGALTLVNALTYGGVTLSNSVTGSGSMVLSTSPTFTGQANFNTTAVTSYTTYGSTAGYIGDAGQFLTGVNTNSLGLKSQGTLYLSANASASPIAFLTSTGFGVGTTSPYALLSLAGAAGGTTPLFSISSSTSAFATTTVFAIDKSGNTTIGNNGSQLTVNGTTSIFNSGLLVLASTTIGNGTQTGGLTISGGATTTGNGYVAGTFGIGTTSPSGTLGILGSGSGKVLSVFGASNTNDGILLQAGGGSGASTGGDVELYGGQAGNTGVGGSLYLAPGSSSNIPGDIFLLTNKAGTNSGQRVHVNTNLTGSNMFGTFNVNGSVAIGSFSSTAIPPTNGLLVSGLGSFTNASTSLFSVFSKAYFGGTATTTIDSAGNLAVGGTLTAYASSTIGGGAQATGLTISGGATTTGNAYFAGNIGIGTKNPTSLLTLVGPDTSAGTQVVNFTNSIGTNLLSIFDDGKLNANYIDVGGSPSTAWLNVNAADNSPLLIGYKSSVEKFRFDNAGDLGIGTTSPYALLSLAGAAGGTTPLFSISSSTSAFATTTVFAIDKSGNTTIGNNGSQLTVNGTTSIFNSGLLVLASTTIGNGTQTGGLTISGGATTTGNAYFAGNVSIGTPVPRTNFQLGPESNTGTHYTFYLAPWDTNSGYAQLVGNWASSQNWGIGPATGATDNTVEIGQVSNIGSGTWLGSQTLKLTVGGGLGIGTTSPTLGLLTISDNTANANTTAFLISSSTSNSTTTLFSISNTGSTTAANGINITAGCFSVNGTCLPTSSASLSAQNTWTALQLFSAGASTTQLSVFQKAYFGGTATTTIDSSGNLAVGGTLTAYASSTIGAGGQTTGLTISGGATTTGSAYVAGQFLFTNGSTGAPGIAAFGNPNTGLNISSNTIHFVSNAIDNWALDNSSIYGTSNATSLLLSNVTPSATSPNILPNRSSNNTGLGASAAGALSFITNGADRLEITNTGSALVGTSTPSTSASLYVTATTSQAGANLIFNVASSTGSSLFQINGNGNITQSGITNSLIAADNTGKLIASSTIGWNLLKGSPSSIFAFDNTGAAIATTSIGTNYLTGTLATINTTAITAGGSFTITAASSTLLSNNNTFSGSNTFSSLLNLTGGASTTQLSVFSKFYAGGTATTTIDSAGNVVVGGTLTSPTVIGGTSVSAHLSLESTSGVGTTDYINFLTNGGTTEAMRIVDSGAIGIGTTSPAAILDVYKSASGATADLAYWTNPNSATSTASRENFRALDVLGNGTTTAAITAILTQNYTTGKGDLTFSTLNSGTLTEGARLNSSGNFGVGSTTPYLPLGVSKTVSTPQFAIGYDSAHDAEFRVDSSGGLNVAASAGNTYWNNDNVWVCTGGSITTNGCPSGSPSGFGNIIAESRIGIGTSTLGTSNAANAFTIDLNNDTTSNLLNIGTSTSGYGTFTSRLKIDSAGRLLVATTSAPVEANFGGRIFVGAGSTAALTLGTATSTFNGDIKILGKLDVGTIDPVYTIDGTKYATYGASQIGVHEETLQTIELTDKDPSTGKYVYTINFDTLDEAGNFWLFYQITDFGDRWKNLVVSLTPSFDGSVFYKKVPEQHRLLIMADQPGEVSMRLSANRFDWSKWPMLRPDQEDKSYKGFQLSVKPTVSEAASAAVAQ